MQVENNKKGLPLSEKYEQFAVDSWHDGLGAGAISIEIYKQFKERISYSVVARFLEKKGLVRSKEAAIEIRRRNGLKYCRSGIKWGHDGRRVNDTVSPFIQEMGTSQQNTKPNG